MISFLKHLIKKYFQVLWLKHRYRPDVQVAQRSLFHFYAKAMPGEIQIKDTGFRVFSQFEEDGKILFLLATTGMKSFRFVEIGADDGLNSNCANLVLNWGYTGLFMDANGRSVDRGRYFYKRYPHPHSTKPVFCHAKVTRENINALIEKNGFAGEIDVLSIDIDGNDFWIWEALTAIRPRIVIIETFISYGLENKVAPYDPAYVYPGKHPQYHGASPAAMVELGRKKDYRLVGANQRGFNFIFLRNDLGQDSIPEVRAADILSSPLVTLDKIDPVIENWTFEKFNA